MKPSRTQCVLVAAAGSLPFCNLHRSPPIAGFWGQWAATVLFAAWVLCRWWERKRRADAFTTVPWPALAFFALAILTLIQAAAGLAMFRSGAAVAAFELMLAGLICMEAALVGASDERDVLVECFAWGVLLALVLNGVSIVGARLNLQIPAPFNQLLSYSYGGREVGLIGQSNHLGMLAVLAWMGAAFLNARGRLSVVPYLALTGVAALICAASSSRTALGVSVFLVTLYFVYRPMNANTRLSEPRATRRLAFVFSAILFQAIQIVWQFLPQPALVHATSVLRSSVSGRGEMLRDALQLGWQHPLLGLGFGNFASARLFALTGSLRNPNADNAHNLFAQAWAEWGSLGLAVVATAIAVLLISLWRNWRQGQRDWAGLLAASWVTALLLHSMVEYPLWFTHFLFPFAWMLGLIPQPVIQLHVTRTSNRRGLIALATALFLVVSALAAMDYRRSESLATRVLDEIQNSAKATAYIPRAEAMGIANLTLFPVSATVMQSRALEIDPLLAGVKLKMATEALKALPNSETMARYIAFLVLNGRQSEADNFIKMIRRRNGVVASDTEKMLAQIAPSDQLITAFIAATRGPTSADSLPALRAASSSTIGLVRRP